MLPEPNPERAVEHGLFSVQQAQQSGHPLSDITRRVRQGRWIRVNRRVLRDTGHAWGVGDDLLFAFLCADATAVIGHRSAAQLYGWDLLVKPTKPELIVSRTASMKTAELFRSELIADEVRLDDSELLRVTTPARTAHDLVCRLGLTEAVVAVDSAFRSQTLRPAEVELAWLSRPGTRGHRKGRHALDLTCPLSGSVPESELRMLTVHAGLPAPVAQYELVVDGMLIGRFDFAWELFRLLVEVDGREHHIGEHPFQADRTRSNASQLDGWLILRFTVDDIRLRPDHVVAQIREALARPPAPRS